MYIKDHLIMRHSYLSNIQFGFEIILFLFSKKAIFFIVISNHDSSEAVIKNKDKLKNFFSSSTDSIAIYGCSVNVAAERDMKRDRFSITSYLESLLIVLALIRSCNRSVSQLDNTSHSK